MTSRLLAACLTAAVATATGMTAQSSALGRALAKQPAESTPQRIAALFPGKFAAGTTVVSTEMGMAYRIPAGWAGSYGAYNIGLVVNREAEDLYGTVIPVGGETREVLIPWLKDEATFSWLGEGARPLREPKLERDGSTRGSWKTAERTVAYAFVRGPEGCGGIYYSLTSNTHDDAALNRRLDDFMRGGEQWATAQRGRGTHGWTWVDWLRGTRLTKYETYNGGGGSGYAYEHTVDLRWDFSFTNNSSGSANFGSGVVGGVQSAQGSSASSRCGAGTWYVISNAPSSATLVLIDAQGREARYEVSVQDGKTYFGGVRYFHVDSETMPRPQQAPVITRDGQGGSSGGSPSPAPAPAPQQTSQLKIPAGVFVVDAKGIAVSIANGEYVVMAHVGEGNWEPQDHGRIFAERGVMVFDSAVDGEPTERHRIQWVDANTFVLPDFGPDRWVRRAQ